MNAAVTMTVVGTKPGRPPIEHLLVDVELTNGAGEPRWILIPTNLPVDRGGGVDKLEQLTTAGGAVGRFLGRSGTYALKLAPGAHVTLRKLDIGWWREDRSNKQAAFDVQLAADVTLANASMATWFDKDPAISGTVELDMQAARHTRSHKSPDGDEIPVVTVDATTTSITLAAP